MGTIFKYSRGKDKYDNTPEQRQAETFDEFAEAVLADVSPRKGMAFVCAPMSFGAHDKPEEYAGNNYYRLASHSIERAYHPIDFDGFASAEIFSAIIEFSKSYSGFVYTTASHTEEAPRARAMFELSRPVTRAEGIRLGLAFQAEMVELLGPDAIKFDESVYRAEQPCYTPVTTSQVWRFNGKPLHVDEILKGDDQLGGENERSTSRRAKRSINDEVLNAQDLPETPGNIDLVETALLYVPSSKSSGCDRNAYRLVIWAIASLGWECGEHLARKWCMGSPEDFNEADFERDWSSYDHGRSDAIGIGSLFHVAGKFGYGAESQAEEDVSANQPEAWPDPEELPPKYPVTPHLDPRLLPPSLAIYVVDSAHRMQVPLEMVATPLIVALGNVMGKKLAVQPKQNDEIWYEFPNLWACVVAPPAMLKSPAMNEGLKFQAELENEALRAYQLAMVQWESEERVRTLEMEQNKADAKRAIKGGDRAMAQTLLDKNAAVKPPTRKRYVISDATPEAQHEIFLDNPNGVMCVVDELDGYIAKYSRDGYESARAQDLQQFDGKQDAASDRIKRGSSVAEAPRKAMYGSLQPAKTEKYLNELKHGGNDGFFQRVTQLGIQPTFDTKYELVDAEPDADAEEQCRAIFRAVAAMPLNRSDLTGRITPRILKFDREAQEHFNNILVNLENLLRSGKGNSLLASHIGKYRGTLPKLALIFAVAENTSATNIGLATLQRAEKMLLGFYAKHAERIYAASARSDIVAAHELLEKIKRGKVRDGFNPRDDVIRRAWSGLSETADVEGAIALLTKHGYLREVITTTSGRPRRNLIVHPTILSEVSKT